MTLRTRVVKMLGVAVLSMLVASTPLWADFTITGPTKPIKANGSTVNLTIKFTGEAGPTTIVTITTDDPDEIISDLSGNGSEVKIIKGKGTGKVRFKVSKNETSLTRSATFYVNGKDFTFSQAGQPCKVKIGASKASFECNGGSGSFDVTAPAGCPWNVTSSVGWIDDITAGGTGNGTVLYDVGENSGKTRTGKIYVAGIDMVKQTATAKKTHTVAQKVCKAAVGGDDFEDLAGVWEMNNLGSPGPWWSRGAFTISAGGSLSSTAATNSEDESETDSVSGTLTNNSDGSVSVTGPDLPSALRCVVDSGKTVIACTGSTDNGSTSHLSILTRKPDTYSLNELAGVWEMNALASPGPWWSRGDCIINSDGTFSFTANGSDSSTNYVSGTFTMNSDGSLGAAGSDIPSALRCVVDSGKTVISCTGTSGSGGTTILTVFTRKAAGYSSGDLAGTWKTNYLESPGPEWNRGTLTINSAGSFSFTMKCDEGHTHSSSGTLQISSTGTVSLVGSDNPYFQCMMDSDKSVAVCTETNSNDEGENPTAMHIFLK